MIHFHDSGRKTEISLAQLTQTAIGFFDQIQTKQLLGDAFYKILGKGNGANRFTRLIAACGFSENPEGFFKELLTQLGKANGSGNIVINTVAMPHLFLMAILELVLPGQGFRSIKTVEQLEKMTNIWVPDEKRGDMQTVIDTYPVRLSMHAMRQMRLSQHIAYQYLPYTEELDQMGHTDTWVGQFQQGLLEQMYQNRAIFLINMSCPVYCRFCFRKHKESRNEADPSLADIEKAVEHVRNSPAIKEILVTGGDPFLHQINLTTTIDLLMEIEHVQTLRLATRAVSYYPELFFANGRKLLNYLTRKNLALQAKGKRIELATHFIHPDEISLQSLKIINELVKSGICVYIQTPFLEGCNDQGSELTRLFGLLRGAGAEMHYIFMPCHPIHGSSMYWSPISKGLAAAEYMRAHLSDRALPRITTSTPIGKMDWHSSGWAVEPVSEKENFIWLRTPYTPEYFSNFAPLANKLDTIRINREGTIDIQFQANVGDPSLFFGPRPLRSGEKKNFASSNGLVDRIREVDKRGPSLVETAVNHLSRVHETRVEVDSCINDTELNYIQSDERITDVIVFADADTIQDLHRIRVFAERLQDIEHVTSLRLRSLAFNYAPQHYTKEAMDALARLNRLTMVNPLRLEIETQFLIAEEITEKHERLARLLKNSGITVYNNTPLLGGINDRPDSIQQLAYRCRETGIEFHHLYVGGLEIQKLWNADNPVDLYDVVDIATKVRQEGSGREIPRYILRTELGEVDFGLTSAITGKGSDLKATLLPYDVTYYRSMAKNFTWPSHVETTAEGHPVVPVTGLVKTTEHPLS